MFCESTKIFTIQTLQKQQALLILKGLHMLSMIHPLLSFGEDINISYHNSACSFLSLFIEASVFVGIPFPQLHTLLLPWHKCWLNMIIIIIVQYCKHDGKWFGYFSVFPIHEIYCSIQWVWQNANRTWFWWFQLNEYHTFHNKSAQTAFWMWCLWYCSVWWVLYIMCTACSWWFHQSEHAPLHHKIHKLLWEPVLYLRMLHSCLRLAGVQSTSHHCFINN